MAGLAQIGDEYGPYASFIAKLDGSGNKVWSEVYGGSGDNFAYGVAADASGNGYLLIGGFGPRLVKFGPAGGTPVDWAPGVASEDYGPYLTSGLSLDASRGRLYFCENVVFPSTATSGTMGALAGVYTTQLGFAGSASHDTGTNYDGGPECAVTLDGSGDAYLGLYTPTQSGSGYLGIRYSPGYAERRWLAEQTAPLRYFPLVLSHADPAGGLVFGGTEEDESTFLPLMRLRRVSSEGGFQAPHNLPFALLTALSVDDQSNVLAGGFGQDYVPAVAKLSPEWGEAWSIAVPEAMDIQALAAGAGTAFAGGTDLNGQGYVAKYGGALDSVPPSPVTDLRVTATSTNSVALAWTAPGDDGNTGTAQSYDVRYASASPITTDALFAAAAQAVGEPAPLPAGTPQSFTVQGLAPATTYYFALKSRDESNNTSLLSNSPFGATLGAGQGRIFVFGSTDTRIGVVGSTLALTALVQDASSAPLAGIGMGFAVSSWPVGAVGQGFDSQDAATNTEGKAGAVFRLGSIPAEYEALCACQNCEAGASTVTFKACGKLGTDEFRQNYTLWGSTRLGTNPPHYLIRETGCALTSVANLINFYAGISTAIARTDPLQLNQRMTDFSVYNSSDDVRWRFVPRLVNRRIRHTGTVSGRTVELRAAAIRRLDTDLAIALPAVIHALRPPDPRNPRRIRDHFMLAIGKCGNDYIIADPASPTGEALYDPNDPQLTLQEIQLYAPL